MDDCLIAGDETEPIIMGGSVTIGRHGTTLPNVRQGLTTRS
ncbi:hypothetical protein RISK_006165 [Rhodopirellula islandica]|uniref:Uncharacterized protein n=1 Tax=Rhodopirellula islandica TaxID=595434 RepID=A0A0J1B6A1_RHOIS|nr:hypothetical protein RISK_006165 [Rhodopirellula islandica]